MAGHIVPHYQNDAGVVKIEIGVREFKCMGAMPPFDHPHIYIDLGDSDDAVCAYCSTVFHYNPDLRPAETVPPGHLVETIAG